jgi:hypothetical protein
MSGAIAKALPTCTDRTVERVGFALGPETFTLMGPGKRSWAERFCFRYNSKTQFRKRCARSSIG